MKKREILRLGWIALLLAGGAYADQGGTGWITELFLAPQTNALPLTVPAQFSDELEGPSIPEVAQQQAMATMDQSSTQPISPDVDEMAAALEFDPVKIYEFVRNDIEYDHQFGWLRSPERTLVDRMGNDMDQAALLVALLHASGYTNAGYAYGFVTLPPDGNDGYNCSNWLGALDLEMAGYMMDATGTPYDTAGGVLAFYHFWVTVTLDGEDYNLDPSVKPHERFSAKDFYDMSDYSRTNLLALAGGSFDTNEVSGLDEDALRNYLESLTTNFIQTLKVACPNSSVSDVLGGKRILPEQGLGTLHVGTPYTITYSDTMPAYLHYIGFVDAPYMSLLATKDLGCQALTVEMDSSGTGGTIYRDDSMVYLGAVAQAGGICRVEYVRPRYYYNSGWAFYWDRNTNAYSLATNSVNAFSCNLGDSAATGVFKKYTDKLHLSMASGASDDSLLRTSLHTIGAQWMTEKVLGENILAGLFQDVFVRAKRYSLGVFSDDATGYHVDIPQLKISAFVSSAVTSEELWAIYRTPYFLASAAEHGVLEQSQPGSEAVSTIELLTLASRATQTVFRVTSNNWSSVEPVLTNYSVATLQDLEDSVLTDGETLILPQDAAINLNSWTGYGYIHFSDSGIGFTISSGANGGYDTTGNPLNITDLQRMLLAAGYSPAEIVHMLSKEPVDMTTGAYIFDREDLRIDGPLDLAFSRHYSSQSRNVKTPMGYGWTHSFNIRAQEHSSPQMALGLRSPEDAAAAALGLCVIKDLLEHEDTAKGWLAAALTARWVMDQLTDNAVTIYIGQKAMTFIKQPDGSFTAPPGMTVSLSVTNDVYVMQERNASTYTFNTNNLIAEIRDPDSNTVVFAYNAQTNLYTVTSSFGPSMTLSYTGEKLTSVSDSTGRSVEYQYDSSGNLTNFVDAADFEWGVVYGDPGLPHCITALTDPEGVTTIRNFYNSIAQVTNQISATSNAWKFYFTGTRNVEEDPYGNQTAYYIDERGRTWNVENALSNRSYTFYDGQNHITNTVDARGATNVFAYDINHNLLVQTHAAGTAEEVVTGYGYDALHHLRSVTNALGTAEQAVTEYTYTGTHHIDTITEAAGTADERVTDLDYNGYGLLQQKTEGNGKRVTGYTYDSHGNPDIVTSTDAGTVDYLYNIQGNLREIELEGVTTRYFYDDRGLLTNIVYAVGTSDQVSESRNYWNNGLLKAVTDARNKTTQYFWTPAYKPVSVVYPDTGSTTNVYDAADRLTSTRDAEQNWTQFQLDALGRVTNTVGTITTMSAQYDPSGQITNTAVDPSGLNLWRKTAYDALNRPLSRQTAIAGQQFSYDRLSRLTNRVDPASKVWKTQYDALGQVRKTYRPSGSFEEYGYDAQGRRTLFYNAERKLMAFGFDAQGRVVAVTNAINNVTSFVYDDRGNLTDRRNAKNELTHYDYNALNRLTNVVHEGGWKASFAYDGNGNIVTQASPLALSSFSYDSMNRLTNSAFQVSSFTFPVSSSYDLNGNRTNIVYPGGLAVGYSYDAENRLSGVTTKYTNSTKTFSFSYDGASRLTGMSYPNGVSSTFGCDAESRVTNYTHGAFISHVITRDPRGFKTIEDIYAGLVPTFTNSLHQTRTHNDADQLTVATSSLTNQVNYAYDPNGNLTNSAGVSYGWDYDNRLVSVTGGSSSNTTVYLYEASGSRIGRIANGVTNYFILDYNAPLKMPLAEADVQGHITRYYIWSSHGLLAHLDMNPTNGAIVSTRYYHADEQGSTLALTDESGTPTDQFAYSPYGQVLGHTGTNSTPYQWLGGYGVYYNSAVGLHLTLHRAYSADMRRWLSADPLGIDGGANLYAYGDLNPLAFVDPLGLAVLLEAHPVVPSMTFLVPGPYGIPQMVTTPSVNHSKITIIPDNQAAYQNNKYFKRNVLPDGRVYTTLGAGPENGAGPFFADLVSNAGRDTDVNRDQNVFSTPVTLPQGMTEDQYIQHLFSTDANYQDNTTYELFPNNWSDDYNSNSYASGLLNATGGTVSQTPPNAPGYGKPLPSQSFGPHISK